MESIPLNMHHFLLQKKFFMKFSFSLRSICSVLFFVLFFSPVSLKAEIDQDIILYKTKSALSPDTEILPDTTGLKATSITNAMSLGDFIVDEKQLLYQTQVVDAEFTEAPAIEVLRGLAEASDINYVLPDIDSHPISTRLRMPAFKALELIAGNVGFDLVKENNLWFFKPHDKAALRAVVYQVHNIHLGLSGGGTGGEGGSTFGGASNGSSNGNSGSGSNNANSGNTTNNNTTTSTTSTTGGGTTASGSTSGSTGSLLSPIQNRFSQGSDVISTIREILGLAKTNKLADSQTSANTPASQAASQTQDQEESDSFLSYNAEANTLYVIATDNQHEWVKKYLATVDKAVSNIAIDAVFIESALNPTESFGTNWKNVASGYKFNIGGGSASTIQWGSSLEKLRLPTGLILDSQGLDFTLRAWITENQARVARYPRVVTANNKAVRIQTTENIPIITNASTTNLTNTASATTGSAASSTQTNFSSGTQEIGTIITLIPQQINEDFISLKIGIEISSADPQSIGGESLSGRIRTTSTVYEGEMKVPTGKTLAIGGLEVIADNSGLARVPWLSQIPLFGFLFKDKNKDFKRSNITLLVTPTILNDYASTQLPDPELWKRARDKRLFKDLHSVEKRAQENENDAILMDQPNRYLGGTHPSGSSWKVNRQ